MEYKEAVENLQLKFSSCNLVEVSRATILREEYEAIKNRIKLLEEELEDAIGTIENEFGNDKHTKSKRDLLGLGDELII
jgi:hypothetical protein